MSFLTPPSITPDPATIARRIRACDYLSVAQLFLQSNFLLDHPLTPDDIKPRLLGHWGTCHGINVAYANLHLATYPRHHSHPNHLPRSHFYSRSRPRLSRSPGQPFP